jgi:hypothetical protein
LTNRQARSICSIRPWYERHAIAGCKDQQWVGFAGVPPLGDQQNQNAAFSLARDFPVAAMYRFLEALCTCTPSLKQAFYTHADTPDASFWLHPP